jgi:putative tryptophan/tyrosine transport system substrate-binding protein
MKRRQFITLLGGVTAAWPLVAHAQQGQRMRRIGALMGIANDAEGQTRIAAFRQELQRLGWIVGGNVRIDERWGAGDATSVKIAAAELVRMEPDVMLVYGSRTVLQLRAETSTTIPIVFVGGADPVAEGIVTSWAHPGGNITGFTLFETSIAGKLLELLREIAPTVARVALIFHPDNAVRAGFQRSFGAAARALGTASVVIPFHDAAELRRALDAFAREPNGGLIVPPDITALAHRDLIISLAIRHHLPAAYAYRTFGPAGGLACYGTDITDLHRRAAHYVDRILKGEKSADLPVQAPIKYELVINLNTAKDLGLTIPPTLLFQADEVIK